MAVFSVVDLNDFHAGLIFDPEHYHPDRIAALSRLTTNSNATVSTYFDEIISLVSPGINDSQNDVFDLTDALGWLLGQGEQPGTINSTKKQAAPGDLVISRLRSYLEEVSIIPNRKEGYSPLFSTEFITLRAKNNSGSTGWLLAFLLSSSVQTILRWSQTGSNHPRFSSRTLLGIPVPEKVYAQRMKIDALVNSAVTVNEQGKQLYPEAEQELLERIGWEALQQSRPELFYVEELDSLNTAGRVDAEHFQPQYRRLRERLNNIGAQKIGALCNSIAKGTQPDGYTDDGQVTVVKSKNVFGQGIDFAGCERTNLDAYSDVPARLSKGDVVVNATGFGTLGRAAFIPEREEKIVASVDLVILRLNEKMILPEYATLFLNSPAGLAQSEMFQTGSSGQLHLYPQHIQEFLAYLPRNKNGSIDLAWQQKLADKVVAGSRAKQEAQAKLNEAKQLVEKAIEAAG